jgi:Raf kinase inhibitor-like YbhB/YbcL family protein
MKVIQLDEAYGWLTQFKTSRLSLPAKQLRDQMVAALNDHNEPEAWRLIERFIWISQSRGNDDEIAEANIEGARAYYRMRYYSQAVQCLFDAVNKYKSHQHRLAVAQWMLGYVLWRFPDRQNEAIVKWQDSCDGFRQLSRSFSSSPGGSVWYSQRCEAMDRAISDTIANGCLPLEVLLSSNDFDHDGFIPAVHTCDGIDLSPHLSWRPIPEKTESFVILMEDLDAPGGPKTHWSLFDYPGDRRVLPQGVPGIGVEGINDFGNLVYKGPCPPRGETHRYNFRVYAIDKQLNLPRGSTKNEIEVEMIGHVQGYGHFLGKYSR